MVFRGELEHPLAAFYTWHSMLARIVLDFEDNVSENEKPIIRNLRDNVRKIKAFAFDNDATSIEVKNCERVYQSFYKEMLRHILISDKNLPQNIDVSSLKKITEDLTYVIYKK